MTTYSDHEQRMLDQQSGAAMDRRAERRHARMIELQEIVDGAYGDGPRARGAARDELARLSKAEPTL